MFIFWDMTDGQKLGRVIFYLQDKGTGYLRLEGTREEFHFRRKNITSGELKKGDLVYFSLREGKQGWYADEIMKAGLA